MYVPFFLHKFMCIFVLIRFISLFHSFLTTLQFDKLLDFVKNRSANGPNVQELSPRDPVDAIPSTTRNSDVMK